MNVLVTGGGGMLGLDLKDALQTYKYHGACLNSKSLDITNEFLIDHYLDACSPDVVVNCAAFTDVDGCERNPDLAYRVNAFGAGLLARACERRAIRLIHISTDYVFGEMPGKFNEWDAYCPVNTYGESKLAGELLVRANCPSSAIIRTQWLFGARGKKSFPMSILQKAAEWKEFNVVGDQWGMPTYTRHLAQQICELTNEFFGGTYHMVNSGEATTRHKFAKEILRRYHLEDLVQELPTAALPAPPAKRPSYVVLNDNLTKAVGIKNMPHWHEAIGAYLSELKLSGKLPKVEPDSPRLPRADD